MTGTHENPGSGEENHDPDRQKRDEDRAKFEASRRSSVEKAIQAYFQHQDSKALHTLVRTVEAHSWSNEFDAARSELEIGRIDLGQYVDDHAAAMLLALGWLERPDVVSCPHHNDDGRAEREARLNKQAIGIVLERQLATSGIVGATVDSERLKLRDGSLDRRPAQIVADLKEPLWTAYRATCSSPPVPNDRNDRVSSVEVSKDAGAFRREFEERTKSDTMSRDKVLVPRSSIKNSFSSPKLAAAARERISAALIDIRLRIRPEECKPGREEMALRFLTTYPRADLPKPKSNRSTDELLIDAARVLRDYQETLETTGFDSARVIASFARRTLDAPPPVATKTAPVGEAGIADLDGIPDIVYRAVKRLAAQDDPAIDAVRDALAQPDSDDLTRNQAASSLLGVALLEVLRSHGMTLDESEDGED